MGRDHHAASDHHGRRRDATFSTRTRPDGRGKKKKSNFMYKKMRLSFEELHVFSAE
jgi:hypothetical protein